jgi:hypothetical protein
MGRHSSFLRGLRPVSVNIVKLHPEFLADSLAQVNLGENLKAG